MNNAYATLLATDDYINGVLGLYYSLQIAQSQYPLIVMVTENISQDVLNLLDNKENLIIKPILNLEFPIQNEVYNNMKYMFNKYYIFTFDEFDRIMYLDGDSFIVSNLDYLFTEEDYNLFDCGDRPYDAEDVPNIDGARMLVTPKPEIFQALLELYGNDEIINQYIDDEDFTRDHVTFYVFNDVGALPSFLPIYHNTGGSHAEAVKKYWNRYLSENEIMDLNTMQAIINAILPIEHNAETSWEVATNADNIVVYMLPEELQAFRDFEKEDSLLEEINIDIE